MFMIAAMLTIFTWGALDLSTKRVDKNQQSMQFMDNSRPLCCVRQHRRSAVQSMSGEESNRKLAVNEGNSGYSLFGGVLTFLFFYLFIVQPTDIKHGHYNNKMRHSYIRQKN